MGSEKSGQSKTFIFSPPLSTRREEKRTEQNRRDGQYGRR